MWTILKKEDLDCFVNNNRSLEDYNREWILHEGDKYYILPRFFKTNYKFQNLYIHEDKNFIAKEIDIEFTEELRDYQKEGAEQLELLWNYNGFVNGLFKAHPGLAPSSG